MNKKGFTLLELLAVIIILAVIALIAAPVVLNIIEQVKIKGAEASAKGYAKAVEYAIINDGMFEGKSFDGEYDALDNNLGIEYQGTGPSEGFFIIENNMVKYGEFCINGYGIKYENSIGKYAPDEVTCGSVPKHEFIEPEGVACTDIENYDDETNFKIKTVEDLVCISNLSNSGKTFEGKKIMLLSDLDINNDSSYKDINDTTYGDINGNGTIEGIKVELTTEKGFLPIGNSRTPFKGTFEGYGFTLSNLYINRPDSDNVGLFGYVTTGLIRGINIYDVRINGNNTVGGVVGYAHVGTFNEINLSGNITGIGTNVGGIVGYVFGTSGARANISSILVNANVSGNQYVGGIFGNKSNYYPNVSGIVETGNITGQDAYKIGNGFSGTSYSSYDVQSTNTDSSYDGIRYVLIEDMLNSYDNALDTWIGGDNDSSGYYFDYDNNNKIVVKSVERNPITFTLKGEGTFESPYLINNYQQWKEATTKAGQNVYIKLNADIDFKDKLYYTMGTVSNKYIGTFDGGNHKVFNIIINGLESIGMFGYNDGGIIKGLNVDEITITSSGDNVGSIVGYNNTGSIIGINISNVTINGNNSVGGVAGYTHVGTFNEINFSGNIIGIGNNVGGIVGYVYGTRGARANIKNILVNANVSGNQYIGGIFGNKSNYYPNVSGIVETGNITGQDAYKIGNGFSGKSYSSYNVQSTNTNSLYDGTSYGLEIPTTIIYTENDNRVETDSLSYYDSIGTLDTVIGGDNDSSGYYFDYNSTGDKIIVVPAGGIGSTNPGGGTTGSVEIDSNYTMTQINGTADTEAPTCELHYVRAVSNGIQASFSCTDDSGVPTLRSLFDSTTSKSAATFDNIGTLKNGTVTGNTKTVVSTWNTNNTVSQPTKGTCYYFRYGAKDAENNFSTYVTNVCYKGFSE